MHRKIKILIPGGTGFIGYHLALFCKQKGWIVHSLSKSKPQVKRKLIGIKYIYCDVRNKNLLKKKLDSYYDYIVNLSGYVDHSNKKSITKIHLGGCKNLVLNFKKKQPKKFIQIGSSIEYGKLKSPQSEDSIKTINTSSTYGNAKLASTFFLLSLYKKESFPATIIRLYLVYGPNQDDNRVVPYVINNCIKNKKFNCSPGIQLRDFIYIDDVIKAIYKTLKSKKTNGHLINIATGKPKRIKDLIQFIVKHVRKGDPIFSKLKFRTDELIKLYPSISKAKKMLKWKPITSLESGLKKTISYYKKNG